MNFSIRRVGLLTRRYFAERARSELVYWVIMLVAFMFIRNMPTAMVGLILIGGAFYASRFFRDLHSPTKGISELMLPATRLEKLTVALLFCVVYYFAMMLVCYVLGNLIGSLVYNTIITEMMLAMSLNPDQVEAVMDAQPRVSWLLFRTMETPIFSLQHNTSIRYSTLLYGMFLFGQSAFLLGGIWFKRSQFFKTLLAYGLMVAALIFLCSVEFRAMMSADALLTFLANGENMDYMQNFWQRIPFVAHGLAIPVLWLASYFRLSEKQV
jgi:hypothetical protein